MSSFCVYYSNPLTATICLPSRVGGGILGEEEFPVTFWEGSPARVMADDFYLKTHLELISTPCWKIFSMRVEKEKFASLVLKLKISPESVTEQTNVTIRGFVCGEWSMMVHKRGKNPVPCAYLHTNLHLGHVVVRFELINFNFMTTCVNTNGKMDLCLLIFRSDSITWNPHKLMGTLLQCSTIHFKEDVSWF